MMHVPHDEEMADRSQELEELRALLLSWLDGCENTLTLLLRMHEQGINVSRLAVLLGWNPSTLYRKVAAARLKMLHRAGEDGGERRRAA
jgi:hypothetical protein